MAIQYQNEEGQNERKSNQSSQQIRAEEAPEKPNHERFDDKDQDRVESRAGEQGQTSGETFDKYPEKRKSNKKGD